MSTPPGSRRRAFLVRTLTAVVLAAVLATPASADWRQFHGGPARLGVSPEHRLSSANVRHLRVVWSRATGKSPEGINASAAVARLPRVRRVRRRTPVCVRARWATAVGQVGGWCGALVAGGRRRGRVRRVERRPRPGALGGDGGAAVVAQPSAGSSRPRRLSRRAASTSDRATARSTPSRPPPAASSGSERLGRCGTARPTGAARSTSGRIGPRVWAFDADTGARAMGGRGLGPRSLDAGRHR